MGPLAFSMEHIQPLQFTTPAAAKDARLKRQSGRGSLAGWRGTATTLLLRGLVPGVLGRRLLCTGVLLRLVLFLETYVRGLELGLGFG